MSGVFEVYDTGHVRGSDASYMGTFQTLQDALDYYAAYRHLFYGVAEVVQVDQPMPEGEGEEDGYSEYE